MKLLICSVANMSEHHRPDFWRAQREAEQVLFDNSVDVPPVLPKQLAENYGLDVVFARFPDKWRSVMGFLDFDERKIFVNLDDPPNRQTFTIAHELGHWRLHRPEIEKDRSLYKVLLRSPMGAVKDRLEQEANAFAANLLVPLQFLDDYSRVARDSELARLFGVSEEVIRYRRSAHASRRAAYG